MTTTNTSSEKHILAFYTYGKQTKSLVSRNEQNTTRRVSALKIGTGLVAPILKHILAERIQEIENKRGHYRYLYIAGRVPKLRHNWLFVSVSAAQLADAERMCRQLARDHVRICLWQQSKWHILPTQTTPYREATSRQCPDGSPIGFWTLDAADGGTDKAGSPDDDTSIIAEYSKLDPNKSAWWWIGGDTYPVRHTIKRYGGRWTRNRGCWRYVGDRLPDGILALLDNRNEAEAIMAGMDPEAAKAQYRYAQEEPENIDDIPPISDAEAERVLGVTLSKADTPEPERLFGVGDTVYVASEIKMDDITLPTGTAGQISKCFAFNRNYGDLRGHSYDVQFEQFSEPIWLFERELTAVAPVKGTRIERHDLATGESDADFRKRLLAAGNRPEIVTTTQDNHHTAILNLLGSSITSKRREGTQIVLEGANFISLLRSVKQGMWRALAQPKYVTQLLEAGFAHTADDGYHTRDADLIAAIDALADDMPFSEIHLADNDPQACETCGTTDGPVGWLPATELDDWVACASCNPDGTGKPDTTPSDKPLDAVQAIRVITAQRLPTDAPLDEIQTAIRQAQSKSYTSNTQPTTLVTSDAQVIAQDYVGRLTGSVDADVHCYGYAIDQGVCVYLNMGGPRSGVEAIRAKLSKADIVNLTPWDAPAIEITAGEGNTGMYTAIMSNMREARFVSCILLHERLTDPNYNGASTTYILQTNEAQAKGLLLHHVRQLVNVPVFDQWCDYLWDAGQSAMLVRNTRSGGGITMKTVILDREAWRRLITGGLAENVVHFGVNSVK